MGSVALGVALSDKTGSGVAVITAAWPIGVSRRDAGSPSAEQDASPIPRPNARSAIARLLFLQNRSICTLFHSHDSIGPDEQPDKPTLPEFNFETAVFKL
jgi:hypothetical protein